TTEVLWTAGPRKHAQQPDQHRKVLGTRHAFAALGVEEARLLGQAAKAWHPDPSLLEQRLSRKRCRASDRKWQAQLPATGAVARKRRSPSRRVTPTRSRYSHSGTAYLRVVPSRSRISATVMPAPDWSLSLSSRRISASTSACR